MGNDSRWYVDNGAGMGFIQRSHIRPYSTREGISDSGVSQQLRPTLITQHLQQSPQTQQTPQLQALQAEVFKSRYDFLSRNAQELSLKANQTVYILEKHDKLGNRDWWYAQTSDGYGYVPANYLSPSNEI
ncbi:DNMBP [Bugula neritina]|uniref:DNMBP n=1 Tax=Bugula neritina TaxID=10212 RepID=A0A7J7K1X8_BUGNE|nr:DNMBP [Bugula neritina]